MINSAEESVYIEQLYIYKDWWSYADKKNPFLDASINASRRGCDVRILLNPTYTCKQNWDTIDYVRDIAANEGLNLEAKFIDINHTGLNKTHNKGVIVDSSKVLISSINWNENSARNNREVGVIVENDAVGEYYTDVFLYDWTSSNNQPPIASFTLSPSNPVVNQTITFDASNSTDPGGTIENYEWDFGDGEKAEGEIITHSYSSAGNYTVKLTVTDNEGTTNSTAEIINIVPIVTTVLVKNPSEVSEGENFTATVNIDGVSDFAILMFKLTYDPSVIHLTNVEEGSDISTSGWSHWNSVRYSGAGTVKVFAFSDPSGFLPISGFAELARLEFEVVGEAGDKSTIDIQGIIGNLAVESIQAIWVDSEVIVTPTEETKARTFVDLLSKGKFEEAHELFNRDMAEALPEDTLNTTWNSVISNVGEFKGIVKTKTTLDGEYKIVFVTCEFANATLDAKIVFDKEAKIAGLWFVPTESEVAYKPPGYANPDSFTEIECMVGSGEWQLPATLTIPKGEGLFPAVILVHGSGPHDRDETIGSSKPFKDLAWGLATKDIAVLRYEKRTKQYADKIANQMENFTVNEETINDALLAVGLLRKTKEINSNRIFILGHSLGGMLAPRIAAQDDNLSGLILLAANTRSLPDMILEQSEYLAALDGKIDEEDAKKLKEIREQVIKVKELNISEGEIVLGASKACWEDLMNYDPVKTARNLTFPILILQGERDYQVTMEDFEGWKNGLGGRDNVSSKAYPCLNHLFIHGTGNSTPAEYAKAGNVAQIVIDDVTEWIKNQAPSP
jgi:PKD repeat protein/dienelactone hydrolase